jgi:hypothetical protein
LGRRVAITDVERKLSAIISSSDFYFFFLFLDDALASLTGSFGWGFAVPVASATMCGRIHLELSVAIFGWCLLQQERQRVAPDCLGDQLETIEIEHFRLQLGRHDVQRRLIHDFACIGKRLSMIGYGFQDGLTHTALHVHDRMTLAATARLPFPHTGVSLSFYEGPST